MKPVFEDRELLEALGDEPELLAFADAFQRVGRPARKRARLTRPRPIGAIGVAAALAATIIAVMFFSVSSSASFTDRAIAAVPPAAIVHAVVIFPTDNRLIDAGTGRGRPTPVRIEEWFDRRTGQTRFVSREAGRPSGTIYTNARGVQFSEQGASYVPSGRRVDPPIAAFLDDYRNALRDDRALMLNAATLNGHRVRWISIERASGEVVARVAVDLSTYEPVEVESLSGGRVMSHYSIQLIEGLQATDAFSAPRQKPSIERKGAVIHSSPVSIREARRVLDGRLLELPSSRYRFMSATSDELQGQTMHKTLPARGVTLTYTDVSGNEIHLSEALQGHLAYGWPWWLSEKPLPDGTLYEIPRQGATLLRKDGVFIAISGGLGDPQDLAAVARSLAKN